LKHKLRRNFFDFQASFRFSFLLFVHSLHFKDRQGDIFFSFFGNSKIDAFSNLPNIVVDFSFTKLQQEVFLTSK